MGNNIAPIPRIKSLDILEPSQLRILFDDGVVKVYNCQPLLARPQFQLLKNQAFFRIARIDPGGYGVSWNDDIDLSEYELWTKGETINP